MLQEANATAKAKGAVRQSDITPVLLTLTESALRKSIDPCNAAG